MELLFNCQHFYQLVEELGVVDKEVDKVVAKEVDKEVDKEADKKVD